MSCSNDSKVLQNTNLGIFYIVHGSVYVVPYALCITAMFANELREMDAYKIMIVMGMVDLVQLLFSSYIAGALSIIGYHHSCLDNIEWWNKSLSSMAWGNVMVI